MLVRECFNIDKASQWKRPKFDLSPHQNPLPIFTKIGMRDYVVDDPWHENFGRNEVRNFHSQNTWFWRASGGDKFFKLFLGFLQLATAYYPERISLKNTSKDVLPAKYVPFGGYGNYVWYLYPEISENPPFWRPILTGSFFCDQKLRAVSGDPYAQVTWYCACELNFVAFTKGKRYCASITLFTLRRSAL